MPSARHADLDLHWRDAGAGPARGVMIHCSLASSKSLLPLAAQFTQSHCIVLPDLPEHGRTGVAPAGVDTQTAAARAVISLIETTGAPVDLMGHSFGATVAARIALMRPDLVSSLTMFEPVFMAILHDLGWPDYDAEVARATPFHDALRAGDMRRAAELFLRAWGLPGEWDRLDDTAQTGMADRMRLIDDNTPAIFPHDGERIHARDLSTLDCPVAVAHGVQSQAVMARISDAVAEVVAHAQVHAIAGAGHMLPITHIAECTAAMQPLWHGLRASDQ